jgi:hypothetical protein
MLLDMSIQPGQKTHIKDQARDWGVKDSIGQSVIDALLDRGQKLRETSGRMIHRHEREVIAELQMELASARRRGCLNAFLNMEGKYMLRIALKVAYIISAELGFNVHEDTPTEILHTILLGVVKYFWGQTVFVLTKAHCMHTLEARLGSLNISGLNIDSISERYICHYTGSLVGKHFKTLAQLMPFACYDLVTPNLLEVWLLLGRLTVYLWFTEIEDINVYLVSTCRIK